MSTYYININPWAVYVKEGEFFKKQGGLTEPWGKSWRAIQADGIDHARLIGELMRDKKK